MSLLGSGASGIQGQSPSPAWYPRVRGSGRGGRGRQSHAPPRGAVGAGPADGFCRGGGGAHGLGLCLGEEAWAGLSLGKERRRGLRDRTLPGGRGVVQGLRLRLVEERGRACGLRLRLGKEAGAGLRAGTPPRERGMGGAQTLEGAEAGPAG